MLKLARLRIVALLPGQLPDETVAEPDKQDSGVIGITDIDLVLEHVSTAEVAMHQRPTRVDNLALDDLTDELSKLLAHREELLVKLINRGYLPTYRQIAGRYFLRQGAWDLKVLPSIVVPPVVVFLQADKVDCLDRSLSLFDPFENDLECAVLWIERISFKGRLDGHSIGPSD